VAWFEFGREAAGDGLYLYGSEIAAGWVGRGRTGAGACTAATRRDTGGASQAKGRCPMRGGGSARDGMVAGWARVLVGWGAGAGWLSDQLEAARRRIGTRATRSHGGATAGGGLGHPAPAATVVGWAFVVGFANS